MRRFRRAEVTAGDQCSGNRRGVFSLHVPGVQWGCGGMGNAVRGGVRLKDLLEDAGVVARARIPGARHDRLVVRDPPVLDDDPVAERAARCFHEASPAGLSRPR